MNFVEGLRFETYSTGLRSFCRKYDVAAVTTLPYADTAFAEHFVCFNVVEQCTVTFFVMLFNFTYAPELACKCRKSVFFSLLSKAVVPVGPLLGLAFCCM